MPFTVPALWRYQSETSRKMLPRETECGFQGTEDLYGLGVRLALYLQVYTNLLVMMKFHGKGELRFFRVANVSLLAAMIVVVLVKVADRTLLGVEIVTILIILGIQELNIQIAFGNTALSKYSEALGIFQLAYSLGFGGFMVWFWFVGLDVLPRSNCPDEYAFVFAKASLVVLMASAPLHNTYT